MKNIFYAFFGVMLLASCGDDSTESTFPVTYVYEDFKQVDYQLYEVTTSGLEPFAFTEGVEPYFSPDSVRKFVSTLPQYMPELFGLEELTFKNDSQLIITVRLDNMIFEESGKYHVDQDGVIWVEEEPLGILTSDQVRIEGYSYGFIKRIDQGRDIDFPLADLNGVEYHMINREEIVIEENLQPQDTLLYVPFELRYMKK